MAHATTYTGCIPMSEQWALPSRFRSEVYGARSRTDPRSDWCHANEGGKASDLLHAVEVALLEKKLHDTQQRHEKELVRIMEASTIFTQTTPSVSSTGALPTRGVGGPVLAARRRGHSMRLWAEDCCSLGITRVHAMDEASGLRNFVDVPDNTISALLASYRDSKPKQSFQVGAGNFKDDATDLDCCLHILLESIRVYSSAADGVLELRHPSLARLCAAAAAAAASVGTQQALSQDPDLVSDRFSRGSSMHDAQAQKYLPSPSRLPEGATSYEAMKSTLADLSAADCDVKGEAPLRSSVSTSPATKPPHRRPLVRPQSAPHSSRRPQSARMSGREAIDRVHEQLLLDTRLSPEWGETSSMPRWRKPRPTSAKALKHRRVVDDGVDSIIYEDVEEEAEVSDHGERLRENLGTGHDQARSGTGGCGSVCSSSRGSVSSRSLSRPRQTATSRSHSNSVGCIEANQHQHVVGSHPGSAGARSRASSVRSERSLTFEEEPEIEAVTPPKVASYQMPERLTPCRPSRGRPGVRRSNQLCPQGLEESPLHSRLSTAVSGASPRKVVWTPTNGQPSIVVPRLGGGAL